MLLPPLCTLAFEHKQSLCTEDIPILECVAAAGSRGEGLWGTAAVFGGRPACLQLCFLRPCESSRPGPSQRSSQRSAPLQHAKAPDRQPGSSGAEKRALGTVTERGKRSRFLYFSSSHPFSFGCRSHIHLVKSPFEVCLFKQSARKKAPQKSWKLIGRTICFFSRSSSGQLEMFSLL